MTNTLACGDELKGALRSMRIMAERIRDQDTEIERLRAALRPFALKHQIHAGYGDEDFKRASEAFGKVPIAALNPKDSKND